MKCTICQEEFGELINASPHLARKHPEILRARMAAVDARMAEPCPSCDKVFPDFDGDECTCGYRRRSRKRKK